MRRAARTDGNQREIVAAFRKFGCSVLPMHQIGGGVPDLLVARGGITGHNILVEIKDGSKSASRRKLTDDQERWHDEWRGPIIVIKSVDDVIRFMSGWPA